MNYETMKEIAIQEGCALHAGVFGKDVPSFHVNKMRRGETLIQILMWIDSLNETAEYGYEL